MQNKKNEKPLGETWQGLYNPFAPRAIEKDNDIVTPLLPVEDVEKPEVVEESPDPELLERMRLSSELREMSTGSGLSQIRTDLRERGVNPLSTSSVQGEVQKANRMRSALNGIGIYADDEGYYDVSAIPQQYLSHYNDMETTGSVDVVRDAEGNIQRVRFGNSDIIPYIDNSITNTTFPTQLSRKAQSDYFRELTTNVISQLPTDENGNITYMGVPYQWSELYSALYPIVAQTAHDESLASNPNYFRWHFQETMGQSYDDWYKEWAAGRIDEIESRIKVLRDEVGAEGRAEGETIGNTEMRGRTSLLPASVRAWMMGALTEDVATKPFDDALEAIKTYRENSFDAGFDEALDLLDVVSFGMMELSTATEQTSILEKARRGEELTKSEQAMLELMQIQQEFEGIKSQLGWEQHWLSKTGSGIGSTVSAAIPFGVGMITTGGVGSMTSLGAGVARNMGVKAAVKQVGKNIVKNTATAYARGAIVAPVMPSTWSAYAQDIKSQYSFNPDGSVAFKPKDKGLMYLGAYIDGMNEFAWEAGGAMLGEIIGHGARFFGRAMRLNNVVDNVLGRVDNTVYGPAVRKAMTWQKSPELREVQRLAGFQGGYLAEASSEVAGDFMSQVMRATVGAETDFEQFKDKDYWITQGLVSVLYGGALNAPHYISNVGEFAKIVGLGKQSQRLIDGIENAELRNRLLSITADGNIDRASSELATIDWSKYHATDKARALDYVRTNYTLQTLSSSVTEDTRTRSYLRDVSALSDNIYHGGTAEENGTIMRGVANDGRSYYVVDGKPNDKSEASMLTCVDAETGVRKAILASNFEVQTIAGYQETVEQMYNERFSASIEAERLASLQSAYEQMDNPTAEDVASIMEQYHIEAPQIGDNVTLADGRTAEVLNNHGDGTYLMQMNEGTSAIVTVPFYSIQSKDALTASAQRSMIEGRAERATEKAVDIAEGAVAEGTVSEEQGMSPIQNIDAENMPTEESVAEAVQTEQAAEEQGANVVLDMESVPRTEDGSVDYDSIDSPKMFARVYESEAGSREQAMADVVEMRDATAAELEASEGKSKGLINPMKKIAARKEREALRQRIALYDGVIRELEGMDAEYSSIYRNQYSEQIAEPTKAVLNDMAKALGLKVRFVENVDEGRANAQIKDDVVEIAFLNRDSSIAFLMGHEFTHRMQDLGGEAYAKFQNMIRGFVGQDRWDAKKNALRAAYETHGKTITDEALDDELTADVAGELVEKKDAFIDHLRKSKADTGILSKLSNWLKKMAGLFRNKGAKEYADSVNDLAMQLDNLIAEATANAAKGVDIKSKKRDSERVSPEIAAERAEIEETAKANGIWLKAPNGKDTNLTPEQWVTVRTKAFKNWFGDWELAALYNRAIEAWNNKDSKGKVVFGLSNRAKTRFAELLDKDIKQLVITDDAIRHIKKKHSEREELRGQKNMTPEDVVIIPYLINNYDSMELSPEFDDSKGNRAITIKKRINGVSVVATIEKGDNKEFLVTSYQFVKSDALDASKETPELNVQNDSDIAKVQKDIENIKSAATNVSKIVDENGEPKIVWHGGQFAISNFVPKRNMHFGTKKAAMQRILDEEWGYDSWLVQNENGTFGWKYEDEYDESLNKQSDKTFATEEEAMEDALAHLDNNVVVKPYFLNIRNLERTDDASSSWDDAIEVVKEKTPNVDGIVYENWYEDKGSDSYIAFTPTQIKSATENVGTFNANNPDIRYSIRELDIPYLDAVEHGDMETAQRMVMEAAEKAGYINDESWRMNHRAPRKDEENANPFNTEKIVPEDFWEHPEWYTNIRHSSETRESYYAMKSAIDKYKRLMAEGKTEEAENVTITMYRGVDKTANKREASFRNGDWITPSRSYALLSAPYGKARVISQEVKLNDIWWDGNSIDEWGYDDGANYGYRDTKNNRKLLDPVTYDDAGNVIPLSERFNPKKADVRYSIKVVRGIEDAMDLYNETSDIDTLINNIKAVSSENGTIPYLNSLVMDYEEDGNVEWVVDRLNNLLADNHRNYAPYTAGDVMYSIRTSPIFYSNAQKAVLDIKQEKATPEQWLKMIEKNGGLKAGEDKWLGLSDWLKTSDKKTLTKDEVLQYIAENDIQIEEVEYGDIEDNPRFKELEKEYQSHYSETYDTIISFERMVEKYGEDFELAFEASGMNLYPRNEYGSEDAQRYLGINEINSTRRQYTTDGLTNKREIALTVPTIESWNTNDDIHFGDAGDGRAVAWIRFGEATNVDGKRVLVIDEIQSKRHQEGREKGYSDKRVSQQELYDAQEEAFSKVIDYESALADKYGEDEWASLASEEEMAEYERLRAIDEAATNAYENYDKGIPSAPFEKNWAELAFKRMLRYAAENGYDYVAWTTGDQQNERYGLSKVVDNIHTDFRDGDNGSIRIEFKDGGDHHIGVDRATGNITFYNENPTAIGKPLADVIGQELADKILTTKTTMATFSGVDLDVTGKGMASFYDQMLPSFVKKYTKKWGAEVKDITMPELEENNTMHAVNVTDSMRDSVMQGQPKFSLVTDVASILEEYDTEGVKYGSILDIADAIESLIAESSEDTTELENILDDFRAAQDDARRWGNRMDSGGEEEFEKALRTYASQGQPKFSLAALEEDLQNENISIDNKAILDAYGLSSLTMSKEGNYVTLSKVVVDDRGKGNGTRFMNDLVRLADDNGWTLALTPDTSFGATSVKRLKGFYKRFGFNENKGRKTDFYTRESMVRKPQGQPKFSLRKYNGNVLQKRTDLEAIMRVYNIVSDIVIAKSEIDYKKALSSFGVEEESFEDSYGVYLDWVRKIILNEEIINTPVRLVSTVIHENTHRMTHHLYKKIAKDIAGKLPIKVVKDFAISELKYTEDKFRKKIGYAGFEVVDEIISIFAERLSLMQMTTGGYVLRKYLEGKLSDDEVMRAAEITINEKYDGKYEVLINASYPLLKEILTTYKNEYGRREKVGGVVTWDNDRTPNGGGGKRGDERGDKSQQKSRYEGENESQTRAGAHQGVEGEVDSRLSIRTDAAIAEEEYKQNLLESAQQMEREGHDAQAIADRTGWVHLADGNWKYYGEGKLAITNEASAQRAAFRWLESKKAIKKAQVATTYDPIIREQKKAIAEIEKNQKDEYKKQRRNVDKVEYILQGQPVESLPIEDQVLVDIALGQRIKWSDGDGKHGLKSELGLQSAKSEGMGAVTLAAKDYVEDYVERLMERNNGYEKSLDDNDIRNAVLEVFRGYPSPKAAIDELYARYKPQADLTQAEDALAKLEYERDSALAAIDAEYREIFDDFDTNPDRYVREHQESESYNANLDMYVGSLGKARADVARLERETTKRKLSDEEKASAMRAVKTAIAKELRDGLGRYTRKYDIQRMMDAVNDARTPYAMLKAIDKAMESLFEIKWRREYARMESLTKMKLTYGVTTTDPTTFLNTLVADHKVTASDARKIMNDYWRGVNASGVAVAKYIDDNTRQVFKFVQKYVDFKDAQVALNKEGAFARNLARELRSQIESNSIANDEIRAMLAVPEVRVMAYEATDILERYWTAQSEQLGVANDKDKREISALGIKVKEITSRIADINAQIKETANKKVVVYKGEAIDADLARKRLTEEYNSLIAERMEAYEKMYSVMPNIIKSMQDANNALENLLRTGRVQLAKERAERMEAERQLVNDAIRDMGAENAVNILDRSIQDTRDIRRGVWYKAKGLAGDTLGAALGSMEYMLRKMGVNAPMGEGRMFDHFAPALQRAYDNIFTSTRECKQILDDKSNELWGKTYPEIHKLAENTKIGSTYDNRDIYVTQALYFLAMWDQADARKAMEEKQGFSVEKIDAIRNALNNLDPRWLEFSDWIIHDFMPSRRDRYNEVHKKLFGTSMAHVSNYFPIKRAKEAIHNDVDVSTPDTNLLPSTVVGAIIERTSNIVPIDVETSFFEALNDNVTTMESWVEMSPIIEDFNALLSSTTVREMMTDISPSMHNDFKEAAKVATLEYVGKIPDIDKNWGTILNRLWAGTKIAFRLFTAFKQLSSALLFAGYSGSPEFQARLLWRYISGVGLMPLKVMQGVINGTSTLTGDSFKKIDIMGNIDWAKNTLPSFARRWEEGFAGNEVMKRTLGNKSWKNRTWVTAMDEVVTEVSRFGFKANAFIDAFTVAAGARAVYDFEVNRLQKEGYSAEKAHTIAVMKAEMMYNSTQQSSEGMYLAPMQKDRSLLATSLSTFMNAPFAMSRNMVVGFNELMRNAKAERKDVEHRIYTHMMKAYRESIENTIISEIDSGKLGDEDAIKARRDELTAAAIIEAQSAAIPMAKAKVKDAKIKAALAIVLNGYGGQLYFNLMSQLPALIFGDDDEEKKQILLDLALHSLWEAPLSMIPVINILPAAINGYSASIFPAVSELIESVVEIVDSIKKSGVDMEVVKLTAELAMHWGLGLEIDTLRNIYLSLESMIEDGVSPEAILKVMNGPEKQIRNIVGQRREDESEKEYVERVMRFYAIFNDPKLEDYFDTDMYVRNAYGAPTRYRSLASRYNGDTPFGMTKSQMQRIKYEEAYRRNVVLRYGGSAVLHDYENTEAQYKDLRNKGVDDFKYGQQQVLQRMSSLVNAKAAALSRRVGKDDPRYYELLLDLQELQQKYIDKYEQFKQ